MIYISFLRGINVGGNNMIKMADLKQALSDAGLEKVTTYIQSGNVLFESDETDKAKLASQIESTIANSFGLEVTAMVLTATELESIATNTPKGWLEHDDWKYNYVFLMPPFEIDEIIAGIGPLKPDIESMTVGDGILYQAMHIKSFGRTAAGKIAGKPVYKFMTFRNHNTVSKLVALSKTL